MLLADLPPGTSDIAISLAQRTCPDGAVLVVTPQEGALDDACRAVSMFCQFNIPGLDLVENMSNFVCPSCQPPITCLAKGETESGRGTHEAEVREGSDRGLPAVLQPDSQAGLALRGIAIKIWSHLEVSKI